jgi:hypothetical protein
MSDFTITVVDVQEHEDGGATYSFQLDEKAKTKLANIGLEFIVTCAATETDIQDALTGIIWLSKSEPEGEDE